VEGELQREYLIEWKYTAGDLVATCTEQPNTAEKKETDYYYTRGGLLEAIVKPDGVEVRHAYDIFARLASITSSDNSIHYTYEYDLNDNVTSVHDNKIGLTHTKTYDGHNRVTRDSIGTGVSSTFDYDAFNRVTGFALASGQKVEYRYKSGSLQDVVRKDFAGNELYTHRYEDFDLRSNVTRSSMINSCGTLQYTWDTLSRLEKVFSQHFEENCAKFDPVGNLLEITETDPQGKMTYSFAYDDLYQLTEEKGIADVTYKNDSINNRLKKNDEQYDVNNLNQLLSEGEKEYTYDKSVLRCRKGNSQK
jgi:YD repeat-containing protein